MITARDLQDSLEELGYDVPEVASSGSEALDLAAALGPDLVLMDINLGAANRDGVQVAAELRDRFGLPVIYLTAYADAATLSRASGTAPLGYLTKPFERRELHATIQMALVKRQLDEQLERARRLESLGTLAGGLAHDLNNILAIIEGNVSMATAVDAPPDTRSRAFARIDSAVRRAKALTGQFLTFSKGGEPVRRAIDLRALLTEEIDLIFDGADEHARVERRLEIAPDLWSLEADEGQLRRVVENLLRNAVQSLPPGGGCITARAVNCGPEALGDAGSGSPHWVRLEVSDNGCGISPEHLAHVCDPYFTTRTTGSGLGLSVCHSIARKHNGSLRLRSVVGGGTTAEVYLPAHPPLTVEPPAAPPTTKAGRLRVLAMDDEPLMRELFSRMLAHLGHGVATASTGEEALDLYEQAMATEPFDAVCIDLVNKIGMGGKEMMARLQQLDPHVVALVCSGYCDHAIMANPAAFGFQGCLSKPINLEQLDQGLRQAMAGRR